MTVRNVANNSYAAYTAEQQTGRKRQFFKDTSEIGEAVKNGKLTVDGVTIELSDEAKDMLESAREELADKREEAALLYAAEFNANVAKQQSEAYEEEAELMSKALETARRIARGGKVPAKDERKLMEYNPDLYKMAKNMGAMQQAAKQKKYKTLYPDDEEREYTDPEEETAPLKQYGIQVEASVADLEEGAEGAVESSIESASVVQVQ